MTNCSVRFWNKNKERARLRRRTFLFQMRGVFVLALEVFVFASLAFFAAPTESYAVPRTVSFR